jgi:hypothetical protein
MAALLPSAVFTCVGQSSGAFMAQACGERQDAAEHPAGAKTCPIHLWSHLMPRGYQRKETDELWVKLPAGARLAM